jgi:peptidoglycan/xylan/chitin deacetylase (PgdA/CDA1 family)
MCLRELVRAISNGDRLDRALVVTFDDGYADLLTDAKPVLEHHRVPATAFLVAGLLGHEFWWDALTRILLTPRRLPERLRLPLDEDVFEWASSDPDSSGRTTRHLTLALHGWMISLDEKPRRLVLDALAEWAGVAREAPLGCRALTPDEVVELARGGLVEVGSHTVTHPVLPLLPVERQRAEIERSKEDLEGLVGREVVSFSYPHGRLSSETAALVRGAGFESACISRSDVIRRNSSPFELTRFWVPDWDGARFSRWLARWLGPPLAHTP